MMFEGLLLKDRDTGERFTITRIIYPPSGSAHPIPVVFTKSLSDGREYEHFQDELNDDGYMLADY